MSRQVWITLLGCVLLAACSPAGPVRRFVKGEELVFNDFSQPDTFEQGGYEGARLQIIDGVYRITVTEGDGTFWWGQWGGINEDVVIDVDVNQLSERNDNMYGVMCRVRGAVGLPATPDPELQAIMSAGLDTPESTPEATNTVEAATEEAEATQEATNEAASDEATEEAGEDKATEVVDEVTEEADEAAVEEEATGEAAEEATAEATAEMTESAGVESSTMMVNNGDSYLFLIRGDGAYAIMRSRGRDVQPLVNWGTTSAINRGPGQNHIRVVCLDDYLALYVNDQFVADTIDDAYARGQVGLVAAAVDRLGVQVEFDNLTISQANPG